MEVSLMQAFSILDGRLSTKIEDVYEMLNYIFDAQFFTHQLPGAMKRLEEANPEWFRQGKHALAIIKRQEGTDDFSKLMEAISTKYHRTTVTLGKLKSD